MKTDMKAQLIEAATNRTKKGGFNSFSYRDLAAEVGIRAPSIHHHFPSKEDLGLEVIRNYSNGFRQYLDQLSASQSSLPEKLKSLTFAYTDMISNGQACLCSAFAGEFHDLSDDVQTELGKFIDNIQEGLEKLFNTAGLPSEKARRLAALWFGTLQGASLVGRANRSQVFIDALASLLEMTEIFLKIEE